MPRASLTAQLPADVADEIEKIVAQTQRSPAYIALQALSAAGQVPLAAVDAGTRALPLHTHDDDPAGVLTKLKAASRGDLNAALTAAWRATRTRFQRWAAREAELHGSERADDLDAALTEAAARATSAERLATLARSPYPRVRALVATHANTPAEALTRLAHDREPYVREAVTRRG